MAAHPKRPRDPNQLAKLIVDIATGEVEEAPFVPQGQRKGAPGGLKGGPARARKLTPKERAEIAKKAAEVRWSK
jgi:hypothetical protein